MTILTYKKRYLLFYLLLKIFFKPVKSIINKTRFSIGYRIINKLSRFISPYSVKTALTNKNGL